MNAYNLIVSFGDGRPKTATVTAKNGWEAHNMGFREFPGARTVRVVGSKTIEKEHPLFNNKPAVTRSKSVERKPYTPYQNKASLLNEATKLRQNGLSYEKIAKELGVSSTTIRKWIKANTD